MMKIKIVLFLVFICLCRITAKKKTLQISSQSVGCYDYCQQNCDSYTRVNDVIYKHGYPGLQIITISNETGLINKTEEFELLENKSQQKKLELFLTSIEANSILFITMHRKCSANMKGWYNHLLEYGKDLNLRIMDLRNYESAIIIACKSKCPNGTTFTQELPLYRLDTIGSGPLSVNINITIDIEDDNIIFTGPSDDNNNINDDTLLIILVIISITCIAIFTIIISCICYRKYNTKEIKTKSSLNEVTNIKVQNWLRHREQVEINKKIQKNNIENYERRKEFDNKAYKGDVVRTHIHVNSFTSVETLNGNVDGVYLQEGNTTRIYQSIDEQGIGDNNTMACNDAHLTPYRNRNTSVVDIKPRSNSSIPDIRISSRQQENSNRESRIYLEPIDGNESNHDIHKMQSMLKTALLRNRSKSLNHLDVHNTITLPSTSSLLFSSSNSTIASTIISIDSTNNRHSNHFAEYVVPKDGIIYKSPSNVRKHAPPDYRPERKQSSGSVSSHVCEQNQSNGSISSHDYEHPIDLPCKKIGTIERSLCNEKTNKSINNQSINHKSSKPKHDFNKIPSTEEHYERLKEIYHPETYKQLEISATEF